MVSFGLKFTCFHYLPFNNFHTYIERVSRMEVIRLVLNMWCVDSVICIPLKDGFLLCFFLGLHLRHVEVPRLGLNSSCSCWPTLQPQQCWIQAASGTCTIAHSNARSLTHWVRPGTRTRVLMDTSWVRYHWTMTGTPLKFLIYFERETSWLMQPVLLCSGEYKTLRLMDLWRFRTVAIR